MMTAMKAREWLNSLGMNRMRFGLDNITELLKRLGDPQKRFRTVHIAGSDGKGSACAMVYSILLNAGIKAGMYTSPHLIRFNERISVNGRHIDDNDLEHLMDEVRPVVDRMASKGFDCTFFEAATAAAFLHFYNEGVEYAVLETGMGGRLDATNTVVPEVTAITNISVEHADILGDTVEKIALEKAGIIKAGVPVVTGNKGSILKVIEDAAGKKNSPVITIDKDMRITSFVGGHATISYKGDVYEIGIPGRCQAENAAIAIECVRHIGKDVGPFIAKGLRDVRWRGRMEYFSDENIIVDVSHTAAGAERLAEDVLETYGKVTLIIGMFNDKSADNICRPLSKIASKVIVTSPDSERAMPRERLAETMRRYSDDVSSEKDLPSAIRAAKGNGTVLITGSLHMAGEAMACLKKM